VVWRRQAEEGAQLVRVFLQVFARKRRLWRDEFPGQRFLVFQLLDGFDQPRARVGNRIGRFADFVLDWRVGLLATLPDGQ
jgi:hypothetical protein